MIKGRGGCEYGLDQDALKRTAVTNLTGKKTLVKAPQVPGGEKPCRVEGPVGNATSFLVRDRFKKWG